MGLVDFGAAGEISTEVENFQPPEWQDKFRRQRNIGVENGLEGACIPRYRTLWILKL